MGNAELDGTLRASIASGGDAINPGTNLILGTNVAGESDSYFKGDLDSLQIYSRRVDAAALYGGELAQARVTVNVAPGSGAAPSHAGTRLAPIPTESTAAAIATRIRRSATARATETSAAPRYCTRK